MDLNDFSFSDEAHDDLDLDIEETIRQQMIALEELDKIDQKEEIQELEPGFLPDLDGLGDLEHENLNGLQGFSLESLGSWQDLMKTMTRADFMPEASIQEDSKQNNLIYDNQMHQDLLESDLGERELKNTDVDNQQVASKVSETFKEGKKEKINTTDKRSFSLDRKKPGRKNLGAISMHNLSRNDDIREGNENTRDFRKKSTLDVRAKLDKGSRTSLQMGSVNVLKPLKSGQKDRVGYKKSIVNLGFVDRGESSSIISMERENGDMELKSDLKQNDVARQEDIQDLVKPAEIKNEPPKVDSVKHTKEIKESYGMELNRSRSEPNIPIIDEKYFTDIIQETIQNAPKAENLEIEKTVIAPVPPTSMPPRAEPNEQIMIPKASIESRIVDSSQQDEHDEDFKGKLKSIESIELNEVEILQSFKRELEASKKRSIFLMREKGPTQEISPEDLKQKEIIKGKILKDAQDMLASCLEQYELIRNALISESDIQKEFAIQLEKNKNQRKIIKGEVRAEKLFLIKQNEKLAAVVEWIMKYAMDMYQKEKDRANKLLQKAGEFKLLEHKRQATIKKTQREYLAKYLDEKGSLDNFLKQLREESEALEKENQQISLEFEALKSQNERLTEIKLSRIGNRVTNEWQMKRKEIGAIKKALEQRNIEDTSELAQLENLDFTESGLQMIPHMLRDTLNLVYLNLSKNQIKKIESLDYVTKLVDLNLEDNLIEDLDFQSLSSPHCIRAANNRIVTVSNIPKSLTFLDLSGNISVSAQSISCAMGLFICILKNTQVLHVSQLAKCTSLLYLDLENSGLQGMDLDFLQSCSNILYLNISNNLYSKPPTIPLIMLRHLDLSYNEIPNFKLTSFLPMLKVLKLVGCRIQTIGPLWSCSFLEEIYLKDNMIDDINCLAALIPCQGLSVIDLTGNGILSDYRLQNIFEIFFKKVKTQKLESNHISMKPLKVIGLIRILLAFLEQYVVFDNNTHEKVSKFQAFKNDFRGFESKIIKILGCYQEPFLNYILGNFRDGIVKTQSFVSEEQYLITASTFLSDIYRQIAQSGPLSSDYCLLHVLTRIKSDYEVLSVTYAQAIWRMKKEMTSYNGIRDSTIKIQKAWKAVINFRRTGKISKALRRRNAVENKSAIKIQSLWKGYITRKDAKGSKSKTNALLNSRTGTTAFIFNELASPLPLTDDLDNGLVEDGNLDVWLKSVNENEFDEKMDSYLSSEKLVHFKEEIETSTELGSKNSKLSNQSLDTYNDPMVPIRHPYHPVEIILLGQRRLTPTPIGHAYFTLPDDISRAYEDTMNRPSEVSSPIMEERLDFATTLEDPEDLGTKKDMLSIRRLYESLEKKGHMKQDIASKPGTSYSNGVSEWCGVASQKKENVPKKINKKPVEKDRDIEISPNPFESRFSSGTKKLKPITQMPQADDSKIVYAWDPQNQSLSAKLKLEHLNSIPASTSNAASLNLGKNPNESAPYVSSTRIPLINNYLFRKMFGNKSHKLPEIKDKSN